MKIKWILRIGTVLIVFLFSILIGGYFWTKSYIRSEEFQKIVTHEIEKVVGGEVSVTGTEWDGWKLDCEAVQVLAAKKFSDLEVNRITVELDPRGLYDRVWRVSNVHVREVSVVVSTEKLKAQEQYQQKPAPVEFGVKDVGKAWLPREAEINNITLENVNGVFDLEGIEGSWSNVKVQLKRESEDYLLSTPSGEIVMDYYPDQSWEVIKVDGRVKSDAVFLNDVELNSEGATLMLTGEMDSASGVTVSGSLNDYPVERALPSDWKQKFSGRLMSSFTLRHADSHLDVKGKAEIENALLTALPVLDSIATFTKISKFRLIPFNTCEFDYKVKNDVINIENIEMESKDFIKITGGMEKNPETIQGALQIGISDALMPRMPIGSKELFSRQEGGYNSSKLQMAVGRRIFQEGFS